MPPQYSFMYVAKKTKGEMKTLNAFSTGNMKQISWKIKTHKTKHPI